jgi:predicted glycosyltransferase
MGCELVLRTCKIFHLHHQRAFDLALGSSVSIGHLTAIFGVQSINFCEDDDHVVPLYVWLAYPFVSQIVNPRGLLCHRFIAKRLFHDSYQKLAYLHPDNFQPDPCVLDKYNLAPDAYTVIRCSAYTAYHDVGQSGFSESFLGAVKQRLGEEPIVLSVENEKSHDIDPVDMHHILAFARIVICDSQSMAVEAAMLGVPSLRMSSFAGKIAVLNELEQKYALTMGFRPDEGNALLEELDALQAHANLKEEWTRRRAVMLQDKVDLNRWMIDLVERRLAKL